MKHRRRLLIISHTGHYLRNGNPAGWGATVTEINYLAQYWEEVVHIACLHSGDAPDDALEYNAPNIRFVSIPPFGGARLSDKLGILLKMPFILSQVRKELKGASEVQLRLPTGIGVILLPWFSIRKRTYTLWAKYAGNWAQENPPLGYRFQRWWLKSNLARCKVTINGIWPKQPPHCYSFENPCLFDEELKNGFEITQHKDYQPPYICIFIGRLENAKGVSRILETLKDIPTGAVKEVHLVGGSNKMKFYVQMAEKLATPVHFHGFLPRKRVHELLSLSHFLLLPSDSEGFPKVVAEAACYGVIPIVTRVGGIPSYINDKNGFLWEPNSVFTDLFMEAVTKNPGRLKEMSKAVNALSEKFTFKHYYLELCKKILT